MVIKQQTVAAGQLNRYIARKEKLREIFKLTKVAANDFDGLVEKFQFWELICVCAWVTRFIKNTRKGKPIHKTNVNQRDRVPN